MYTPRPDARTGKLALSTYRTDGLEAEGKRRLGEWWAQEFHGPNRRLKSCVELPVGVFKEKNLSIDPDDDPPKHVNVLDWPEDLAEQLDVTNELCAAAEEHDSITKYRKS